MIRSKLAIISSFVFLGICLYSFFPFPNNPLLRAQATFMNFPIQDQNGYVLSGIFCSALFIISFVLLAVGVKKHRIRTVILVFVLYLFLPNVAITLYQGTVASGIFAISYDKDGSCHFESIRENLLNGECTLTLRNHSNHTVSFSMQFLDNDLKPVYRTESLMNEPKLEKVTLKPNEKRTIHLEKKIDISKISRTISGGTSNDIHFKLIAGEFERDF
ncbi:hypothetical protein QR721_08540 [Aciduricibacillus chroicocephali]|uniref:Uncharacterized protein n=1 Tax=Aciduricibacillus chroicocephali TaxID=3054939 RepID=A0ABY9KVB0_9BACI|nr:hypothetical protein QR721_08540 [Bacillaceae bacterium 44XB]